MARAEPTSSSIGFKFAKQPPSNEVRAAAMMNPRFMIPAGAAHHPVEARMEFVEDVTIYSLTPHTHLRGKAWEYTVTYPDGRNRSPAVVPKYDFNWQTDYVFATPLRVPKGSILKSVAHYDNSKENKANPDRDAVGLLGRSDLGRDAVHGHHVQHRQGSADDDGPTAKVTKSGIKSGLCVRGWGGHGLRSRLAVVVSLLKADARAFAQTHHHQHPLQERDRADLPAQVFSVPQREQPRRCR